MPQLILSVEGVQIQHLYLHQNRTTLGRKPHNDIVLDNPVVSGEHCVFELHGLLDVYIEDLRSTNGTYINGKMIARQRLADHDLIAIGKFKIQFLSSSEPPDFGVTSMMKLDVLGSSTATSLRHASFQVLSGSSAGLEVPVVKAVTTYGKPGVSVVAVSHRRNGYYVAHMDGNILPKLNGDSLGPDAVPLADHDVLELAGTRMLFLLKE
jgi:FHA domain